VTATGSDAQSTGSPWPRSILTSRYGYLVFYNIVYMLDDSIMLLIAVITLSRQKMQQKEGRWLKLVSGAVMAALGVIMLVQPGWLAI